MSHSFNSKLDIISRIKKGLAQGDLPIPYSEIELEKEHQIYKQIDKPLDQYFEEKFSALGGYFMRCNNYTEIIEQLILLCERQEWKSLFCTDSVLLELLKNIQNLDLEITQNNDGRADVCITNCEALIARTGSFLMSSHQKYGRTSSIFYPNHIVIAAYQDLVKDIEDGYQLLIDKYTDTLPSMISIQTGPSRTADIEKTLVKGVHGPKDTYCILLK